MNSFEKPVQKHYRFPLFSLPREVRDNINRALFVSNDFVNYYDLDTFSCIPETYEMLENIYETTTSVHFLQESLETFFRDNVFRVLVEGIPFLLKYRRFSLLSKEQLALPPYILLEAMKMSTTYLLAGHLQCILQMMILVRQCTARRCFLWSQTTNLVRY